MHFKQISWYNLIFSLPHIHIKLCDIDIVYSTTDSTIAITLVETPITRANRSNAAIKIFLPIIKFNAAPFLLSLNTSVSNKTGKDRPSNERHKAPNKEMNKPNFGIATARTTVKIRRN